ncbi:hypothetical protein GOP47_0001555 [Adiantum capillus-veneris]|uniref:C3H1-type domain-containing protein n=1 Tax=Adiantum capillus-veneris TaxID=13818 RepID=A0A9D4V930_ADICA|nr:hypothetical protein GOP47_0001555 [Adiantum capillus-veneris]
MGDEAQKRNTDCVYFLASPLTCKKGADCEYRHSEAARVNPRDCWYWLSGNCLNASCSFRHPPLDGRPGVSASNTSQVAGGPSSAATSTTATIAAVPSIPSTQTTVSAPSTVSEQPANGEGNGVSHAKQQSQDRKPATQIKAPVKAAFPSQEAGYVPSNVYKLSASGVPPPSSKRFAGNAGEKVEQISQVGRLKPAHNADDTTRHAQIVESRISQAHFSNECIDQFAVGEKGSMKGQLLHLGTTKQGRQSSATYAARASDTILSSEMQDPFYEPEGLHSARELHADDLRNHLKRKKNDTVCPSQLRDFHAKEFPKDRLVGGRLASRAVPVAESKDFVPVNSKRAKQEKESSTFSGPKSLAQIKAEKSKGATEGSSKAADSIDDCKSVETDPGEVKEVVESASELRVSLLPETGTGFVADHYGNLDEETKCELKKAICSVDSMHEGTSQNSRHGVGINDSNGLSSDLAPPRVSKQVETAVKNSSEMDVASISKGRHSLRKEATIGGNKHAHHAIEGNRSETDCKAWQFSFLTDVDDRFSCM